MSYLLEFTLPGLPKVPNQLLGSHWRTRSHHARIWQRRVWEAVWPYRPKDPLKVARLTLTRVSYRQPDYDNLVLSFKPCIDGLVRANILVDDKPENIGGSIYQWEKGPRGQGKIRILIEGVL